MYCVTTDVTLSVTSQVIAVFALAHSRFANIWVCSRAINLLRHPETHVPETHQFMLWFSGLRGAIAFALSLQAVEDMPGGKGQVLLTATYFIILITVSSSVHQQLLRVVALLPHACFTEAIEKRGIAGLVRMETKHVERCGAGARQRRRSDLFA